jgi:hypothetical protein
VDKINITPADLNDKGKQASGFFKSNYKKIISAFLLLMIVLTMIMELSIDMEFTFRDLGNYVILITIYILNLVVNADDGKDAGRRDKRYTAAKGDYSTINDRVIECGSSRYLEAFCRQRREDNLIERRRAALSRANIGYAKYLREYIGHKPPRELSKDKREAIKWANGMRMENLSPNMLLTAGKKVENHRIMGDDPVRRYRASLISKVLFAAVLTFIMADITGSDVSAPTMVRVAAGVAKLISYMVSGYFGYYTGYNHIALDVTAYTVQQTRLLHEFEAWVEEHKDELFRLIPHVDEDQIPEGVDALTGERLTEGDGVPEPEGNEKKKGDKDEGHREGTV